MWFNPLVQQLLHSPLHGLVDNSVMVISYKGRKSGKSYSVPVNYLRVGEELWVVSMRERIWWRNLREGAAVTVCVQAKEKPAIAVVTETPDAVAADLIAFVEQAPRNAHYLGVEFGPDGEPKQEDVVRAAQKHVVVRVQLTTEPMPAGKEAA